MVRRWPHTTRDTQNFISKFGWEQIDHPPYSPDLPLSDFHLFLHLKKFLSGQHFDGDEEVKTVVREWFVSQAGEFYNGGIEGFVPQIDKCLNNGGDYVEKRKLIFYLYFTHHVTSFLYKLLHCGRLFWTIAVSVSLWGTIIIALSSYRELRDHSVSFVVETTYLDWNTTFPAITVCADTNGDYVWDVFEEVYPSGTPSMLQRVLEDLIFYRGTCYQCESCKRELNCSNILEKIVPEAAIKCEDILTECKWNDKSFNCCDHFLPLRTELGNCFTVNSIQTREDGNKIKMISNRKTGPGTLVLRTILESKIYLHSSADVVTSSHDSYKSWTVIDAGEFDKILFKVVEIQNDPLIRQVSIEGRGCRFPDEKPDYYKRYKYYSYSTCVTECRIEEMLKSCNCVHHILQPGMKENYKQCDIDGLICLNTIFSKIYTLNTKSEDNGGITCDCKADCNEPDQFIIQTEKLLREEEDYSEITFQMDTLPHERLRRNAVRSKLDLVVSLGGIAGLFLGASLISAVEFFIYMFVRIWVESKDPENPTPTVSSTTQITQRSRMGAQQSIKRPQYSDTGFGEPMPYYENDYGIATAN
ncbi:sodium channel protein Nach-like [Periplaneta americana]|uniref:sodium channel protein Nach-like n=1 Tax=Periplaneta americana TaxID=6978 RepID=UPI0037E8D987